MPDDLMRLTQDGLPVVSEDTFLEVVTTYPIASTSNSPEVRGRIEKENSQIARIIRLGMGNTLNKEARLYFEMGCQLTYELLRIQSKARRDAHIQESRRSI